MSQAKNIQSCHGVPRSAHRRISRLLLLATLFFAVLFFWARSGPPPETAESVLRGGETLLCKALADAMAPLAEIRSQLHQKKTMDLSVDRIAKEGNSSLGRILLAPAGITREIWPEGSSRPEEIGRNWIAADSMLAVPVGMALQDRKLALTILTTPDKDPLRTLFVGILPLPLIPGDVRNSPFWGLAIREIPAAPILHAFLKTMAGSCTYVRLTAIQPSGQTVLAEQGVKEGSPEVLDFQISRLPLRLEVLHKGKSAISRDLTTVTGLGALLSLLLLLQCVRNRLRGRR